MTAISVVEAAFDARLSNDADRVIGYFHEGATYAIAGDPEASPIACETCGAAEVGAMLTEMVAIWRWRDYKVLNKVVDGEFVAIRYRLTLEHAPTGRREETVIFDLIEMRGDKIFRLVEHLDTSLVNQIIGPDGGVT